jgi:predicted amidophosphoribosyltransferase
MDREDKICSRCKGEIEKQEKGYFCPKCNIIWAYHDVVMKFVDEYMEKNKDLLEELAKY